MEYRLFKNNLIWYIAAGVVLLSLGVIIATSTTRLARADDNVASADERVITLHDDGVDKGFITKKATLREALAEQNIRVDANDRTEPGLDEKLVAHSYQVNVYRARPVVIRDGGSETKITTSYRSAKQIAKQAQMTLHDEDKVEMSVSMNPINDGASEVMNVTRATPFMFNFYGKAEQNYTLAKTVGDMLKEKGIKMGKDDGITPALSTPITSGMEVKLWRNGVQTVTVDEDIAFDTKQVKDADHDIGYKEVQTPGENGKRTVTYEINMQNGVEVSRKEINSNTTKQPVQQVEIIGAKFNYTGGPLTDAQITALGTCESGMTASRNSGNGFYGAFQFIPSTWSKVAPGGYGGILPSEAPLDVQKQAVQNLLSGSNIFTQFPGCAKKMRASGVI